MNERLNPVNTMWYHVVSPHGKCYPKASAVHTWKLLTSPLATGSRGNPTIFQPPTTKSTLQFSKAMASAASPITLAILLKICPETNRGNISVKEAGPIKAFLCWSPPLCWVGASKDCNQGFCQTFAALLLKIQPFNYLQHEMCATPYIFQSC